MSKRVKQNTNRFYEGVRVVARVLLCVFFRITYVGLEHIPTDQGYLLCSNHRSYLDAFFIGYKIPVALRFVAKDDLFRFRAAALVHHQDGRVPDQARDQG